MKQHPLSENLKILDRYRAAERLPTDNESLRDALEKALKRIEVLEEEVARMRGELPPSDEAADE